MNLKSSRGQKVGLNYFSVDNLRGQQKDQLLQPRDQKSSFVISNPPYIIKNVKKETEYLDSLTRDIHFSAEVAADRCVHLLPYDELFYETLYRAEAALIKKPHSSTQIVYPLPLKHRCANPSKDVTLSILPPVRHSITDKYKADNSSPQSNEEEQKQDLLTKDKRYWDEYFLSLLSKETAQYIAFGACHNDSQAKRLQELVEKWYGPPPLYPELIPSDKEESSNEFDLKSAFPYKYYMDLVESQRSGENTKDKKVFINEPSQNKKISDLLSREMSFYEENQQTDPYGDETLASFYRLPLLLRRQKKSSEMLHNNSGNKTTENLKPFYLPSTSARRLDTELNPRIGDKVFMTDNQFQQDLLFTTEINQEKVINSSEDVIKIEDKIYRKCLQPIWPAIITSGIPSEENLDCFKSEKTRVIKGHNRWINLPEKEEMNLRSFNNDERIEEQARLESRKKLRENSGVNLIVDQWRKKWQLTQKYSDSTVEALLKDMGDAHPTIRMQAIVTVAKSGIKQASLGDDQDGSYMKGKETIKSGCIPEILLESIEILLEDSHYQVRKAAAVGLHSLERSSEMSLKILRDMLHSDSGVDRWTSAQCLALSNVCDSHVIAVLVDQLMNSEDFLIHEKASLLLAKISFHTKLVHGMLGEKLNTISWRQRIIICKTLPLLHGPLNKDILKKLIFLMWQDDHKQVKIAASQVVGKTGNGKAVHDELITKLQHQSEIVRADALEKIGILKVMTTRMMPSFIKTFSDQFVIVRKEVCRTCYKLAIQDELCTKHLLEIAEHDPSSRVKINSLRALGRIRLEKPEIRLCFIWALQYESEVSVRHEALRSLLTSNKMDQEIVDLLKARFLVEDHQELLKLIRSSLNNVGINPDEDIDAVAEVKTEVKRFLSDKWRINELIFENEARQDYLLQRRLMIADSKEVFVNHLQQESSMVREGSSKTLKVSFLDSEGSLTQSSETEQEENILTKEDSQGRCTSININEDYVEIMNGRESIREKMFKDEKKEEECQHLDDEKENKSKAITEYNLVEQYSKETINNNNNKEIQQVEDIIVNGIKNNSESEIKDKKEEDVLNEEAREESVLNEEAREESVLNEEASEESVLNEEAREESVLNEEAREESVINKEAREESVLNEEAREESVLNEEAREESVLNEEAREESVLNKEAREESIWNKKVVRKNILNEETKVENKLDKDIKEDRTLKEETQTKDNWTEEDKGILYEEAREESITAIKVLSDNVIIKDDDTKEDEDSATILNETEKKENKMKDVDEKNEQNDFEVCLTTIKENMDEDFEKNVINENMKKQLENEERVEEVHKKKEVLEDFVEEVYEHDNIIEHLDESESEDEDREDPTAECRYQLPLDSNYLKGFTKEKSMSWITLTAPSIHFNLPQLDMLERTMSPSLMEEVNLAIEYEGFDCSCEDQ